MAANTVQGSSELLGRMVASRQLSSFDADALAGKNFSSEEEILRWLANEYGLGYTTLDDVEPDPLAADPDQICIYDGGTAYEFGQ